MKKNLLTAFAAFLTILGFAQSATNFTANDCSGASHTLFTELDAGKVIVITWVMPCAACIAIASTSANTAQGFSSSYPGRVKFYLTDDYADTPCSTLTGWANTNSITTNACFSDASINMADYGGPGGSMQKTVVLGGANHTVFYNVNGTVTASAIQTAISNALAATSGVANNNEIILGLSVFPSPASSNTRINYSLTRAANINIELVNLLGEKISLLSAGTQSPGKHEFPINVETLNEGIYFVKLNAGELTQTIKFTIIH
jgi:hypothetical protein